MIKNFREDPISFSTLTKMSYLTTLKNPSKNSWIRIRMQMISKI